jgi:magnesium-transporting ATPase (P-type)
MTQSQNTQQLVSSSDKNTKKDGALKVLCTVIKPIHAIQVLIGISVLVCLAYAIGMMITIDKTLKDNGNLTEDEFQSKYHITRIQLYQLRDLFIFVIVALSCMITVWLWNYVIPLEWKVKGLENPYIGVVLVLFFFIVSIVSFFEISKKSFANEHIKTLNIGTIFFLTLILFIYGGVFVYNKYFHEN